MLTLSEMPPEILAEILWNLHWSDLNRCRSLSKKFSNIIQESQLLQYSLELGRRGYILTKSAVARSSIPECIAALHHLDELWKEPRFKKVNHEPIPLSYAGWDDNWTFYANYLFLIRRHKTENPSPNALCLGIIKQINSVNFDELLDGCSNVPKFKSFTFGSDYSDWNHDLFRELIILFDKSDLALYLLSSRDQKLHPAFKKNPIFFDKPKNRHLYDDWRIKDVTLFALSDYMMVKVVHTSSGRSVPSYYLMNFVTGEALKEWILMESVEFYEYRTRRDESGNFYLLVLGYQKNPFGGSFPFLQIYSFPGFHPRNINLLATFMLPTLRDINTPPNLCFASDAAYRVSSPFKCNPSLVVVEFGQEIWFITHVSTILSPEVTQRSSGGVPLVFPWHSWGPPNVRTLFCDTFGFETSGNIVGCRILLGDYLLDFDRQRVADALQNPPADSEVVVLGGELDHDFFDSSIVFTRLPYIRKSVVFPTSSVSLSCVMDLIECMDGLRAMKWYFDQHTVQFLDIFALY